MRARRIATIVGLALLANGLVLLTGCVWQFWGTDVVSVHRQRALAAGVERAWRADNDSATSSAGPVRALVRIPAIDGPRGIPLLGNTSTEALALGFGHVVGTAEPGQVGNLVIAGHRVTHGAPLAGMPRLRVGDVVIVQTRRTTYVYQLDTSGTALTVDDQDTWVLGAVPSDPDPGGVSPPPSAGRHLLTLITCAELFHTDQRLVAFGHLIALRPTRP